VIGPESGVEFILPINSANFADFGKDIAYNFICTLRLAVSPGIVRGTLSVDYHEPPE